MVKDNFDESKNLLITLYAKQTLAPINSLIQEFREHNRSIAFSSDAYYPEDFILKGRMRPHSLAGTKGAEIIDELERLEDDLWLLKLRFSAFFEESLSRHGRDRDSSTLQRVLKDQQRCKSLLIQSPISVTNRFNVSLAKRITQRSDSVAARVWLLEEP
jgi:nicotinamidase-related amidase